MLLKNEEVVSKVNSYSMSNPIITVAIDAEKDVDRFIFFLTDEHYRAKRRHILQFYPSLRHRIEQGESLSTIVRGEVLSMYERFAVQVQAIITLAMKEFSESASILIDLAQIMDFPQIEKRSYVSIPTFLPFSPLEKNLFYFSIAKEIAGRPHTKHSFLAIGVHEISHFIFSEQYERITDKNDRVLNKPTYHYVKEALTAAIMNQKPFRLFFDYPALFHSETYAGNPELHHLFLKYQGEQTPIVQFFEKHVLHNPRGYRNGLGFICRICADANDAFAKRWELWNTKPDVWKERDDFLNVYREPISLDK